MNPQLHNVKAAVLRNTADVQEPMSMASQRVLFTILSIQQG
jgi:hypothetical protein